MTTPVNAFKESLMQSRPQRGMWCTLGSAFAIEVVAGAGFDWLLIDMEHSPNDMLTVLAQLHALAGYPVAPVVRVPENDSVLLKRLLDLGVQNFMIPDIANGEDAKRAVESVRYPPAGKRGVSALTRASNFGRIPGYPQRSDSGIALIAQIESPDAIGNIEQIAAIDGIDALFVGPGDLAARMGFIGEPMHPNVVEAVEMAVRTIVATSKAAGLLTSEPVFAARCADLGASLLAVGVDVGILGRGADALAKTQA